MLAQMEDVKKAWWQTWANERLSEFIPRPPKWISTSRDEPAAGSVVLFTREETDGNFGDVRWRIGIVEEAVKGSDGICRQLKIKYKNAGESVFRTTTRAIRRVALLHGEAELGLIDQLNDAARATDVDYTRRRLHSENVEDPDAVPDAVPSPPQVECCCFW